MQVSKWGDDLAVRLPSEVVDGFQLKEGDEVEVQVTRAPLPKPVSDEEFEASMQRIRKLRRALPPDYKFSREEANGH